MCLRIWTLPHMLLFSTWSAAAGPFWDPKGKLVIEAGKISLEPSINLRFNYVLNLIFCWHHRYWFVGIEVSKYILQQKQWLGVKHLNPKTVQQSTNKHKINKHVDWCKDMLPLVGFRAQWNERCIMIILLHLFVSQHLLVFSLTIFPSATIDGFPRWLQPLFLTGIFGWWWLQTPEACCGKRRDSNPGGPKPPIFRAGRSPIIVKSRLLLLVKHHLFWVLKLNKSQFLKRTRLGPRVSLKFLVWKQSSPKFGG